MGTTCTADTGDCGCVDCAAYWEAQAESDQAAEAGWLRAAEYDARMDDPLEW